MTDLANRLKSQITTSYLFDEIVASDATEYTEESAPRAVMAMTAGDVVLRDFLDNDTTIVVAAGQYLYVRPKQFRATGSTATLLGLF